MLIVEMIQSTITYLLAILLGITLLMACAEDIPTVVVVHSDLQVYFDSFEFEAEQRGIEIDLFEAEVQGFMQSIDDRGVVGQCIENSDGKSIVIDLERWQRLDQLEKEFIVFHELGHCYLGRPHIDTKDNKGECLSMMHSSTTVCDIQYNSVTRAAYLDELFLN